MNCSHLLWGTFYFLQVFLHHLLWGFTCRQERMKTNRKSRLWFIGGTLIRVLWLVGTGALTLASLFLGGLPAAVAEAWHGFDVALADGRRVQHQFRRPGQTHGQSGGAHQDPCDP